ANKSIVGAAANDRIGGNGVIALSNGSYVAFSAPFNAGRGAATWASGLAATSFTVSSANSLVGSTTTDNVGSLDQGTAKAFANGNYAFLSGNWGGGGAMTLGHGNKPITGLVSPQNSVIGGGVSGTGRYMTFAYDSARDHLIVGRSQENI